MITYDNNRDLCTVPCTFRVQQEMSNFNAKRGVRKFNTIYYIQQLCD